MENGSALDAKPLVCAHKGLMEGLGNTVYTEGHLFSNHSMHFENIILKPWT